MVRPIVAMMAILTAAFGGEPELAVVLGDQPGDVQRIDVKQGIGAPALLPDGRVMMCEARGETGQQKVYARFSRDHGVSWSKPQLLFELPQVKGSFGIGPLLVSRSGTIHIFGNEYYGFDFNDRDKSLCYEWHTRSTDGGRTWSPVQHVDFGYKYTGASNNAFELASGRILVPLSALSNRRTGAWVSLAPYSDDDGVRLSLIHISEPTRPY
mgnify:CR=1 FL=1